MIRVYKNIPGCVAKDGKQYYEYIITCDDQFGCGNSFKDAMKHLMSKDNSIDGHLKDVLFDAFNQIYAGPDDDIFDLVNWAKERWPEDHV